MLKILRNRKTAKKIWIGLAIIIIPAFTMWGFGGSSRDKKDSASVGKIAGKNVSSLELRDSLTAVRTMAIMQFGDRLGEIEQYLNFEGQAWERLALLYEAKKRHINASDKEVIDQIQNAAYFQNQGVFNNRIYQEALRYVLRVQPRTFEEQTRQNLILAKLYKEITKDLKLNDETIRQEYLKTNQELNIYYIASEFKEFSQSLKPSEQEIKDYYAQNKEMFKEPPVSDQPARIPELDQIHERVKGALIDQTAKEKTLKRINECAEKLKQKDFKSAAAACKLKSGETDYFKSNGTIPQLGVGRIFWDNAINLKDNQPSGVISNTNGHYIIKLKSLKPIDESVYLKEKEGFAQRLLSTKQNELFTEFTDQLMKKAQ